MIYVCIMKDTCLEMIFGRNYRIIKLFLRDPEKEFYLSEASERLKINKMSVYRALEEMVRAGLMKSRSDRYRKYYKVKDSHLTRNLKILVNLDSPLVAEFLKRLVSRTELILLFGSRASGTYGVDSDWDFLVVSDEFDVVGINTIISDLESRYDQQINVKLYTGREYREFISRKTQFYREVMNSKIILAGKPDEA